MRTLLILVVAACLLVACGGGKKTVTRLDTESVTDLSGQWNDTDSRLVAEEMVRDCLGRAWLTEFAAKEGRKPVVTVSTIRNLSSEHINTETFTTDFERELINSAQVKFVAAKVQREDVYDERTYQQEFASPETMKRFKQETGADYVLLGAIKTIVDQEGGAKVVFYQTDLELIHVETAEKSWIGTKKIKKGISQGSRKW
ncbi:MAG: penicillin-binding protein activator LpoB [candidate division Zixibacteria bacterium]|nr:penicillin-binding protein activator LpoB [candidate division Zixibacteria bacterium]